MIQHFISDLHLCEEQPHLLRLFEVYLERYAPRASHLYILGDLFEVWIGDDYLPDWLIQLTKKMKSLSSSGTQIFFCHGNRDFLLGHQFAQLAGLQLLNEYATIALNDRKVLLCHGDTLCTDDAAYQAFRSEVRTEKWQSEFLSLSIEKRLAIVNQYRQQSKQATAEKTNEIMDVNNSTVNSIFDAHQVQYLIHGHTHRPATHRNNGRYRIVLSDWGQEGQYLEFKDGCLQSFRFDAGDCSNDDDITMVKVCSPQSN